MKLFNAFLTIAILGTTGCQETEQNPASSSTVGMQEEGQLDQSTGSESEAGETSSSTSTNETETTSLESTGTETSSLDATKKKETEANSNNQSVSN